MENSLILVADDDRLTRRRMSLLIESWGYSVVTAESGEEALEVLRSESPPRVALLDWIMPGLSGPEVCRRYRQESPEHPAYLILFTIRNRAPQLVEGLDAGADDYLIKPVEDEILRARLGVGIRLTEALAKAAHGARLRSALEVAGAICHEINQPLQAVLGNSELLAALAGPDDPTFDSIQEIRSATERIGALTRKLMRLTRYETKPYLDGGSHIFDIERSATDER